MVGKKGVSHETFNETSSWKVKSFLDGRDEPISSTSDPLIEAIQKALQKKTAVHIIFSRNSFTGDIIKYDNRAPATDCQKFY